MALDPVTALLDVGGKVIDRLWPDPLQAAQAKRELIKLQQSGDLAQIAGQLEINKAEAASPSPFTSGWRPFIGWTCGAGFAVQFVGGPVGEWVCALAGHPVRFPQMDLGTTVPLLFGMLGLGAYRTAEKVRGWRDRLQTCLRPSITLRGRNGTPSDRSLMIGANSRENDYRQLASQASEAAA